jgi:hypothetical protein
VQGSWRVSVVHCPADGRRCRAPGRSGLASGALPPVGLDDAAQGPLLAGPRRSPDHARPRAFRPRRLRLAAPGRPAARRGGPSTSRRRHVHPALRRAAQPQHPLPRCHPRRCRRSPCSCPTAARAATTRTAAA